MFIEIHFLQSFAPSNLNRDDTGNPKDTEFGGVRRARISSQCIKRSIRNEPIFTQKTTVETGVRTRWMNRLLVKAFVEAGKEPVQAQTVADAFALNYSKMDKGHTSVLIYLSASEVKLITGQIISQWDEVVVSIKDGKSPVLEAIAKEIFKTLKNRTGAPDIALFGRMLAEKPELNIDAACQVAHAISTHRVNMELDYYTAVDDLTKDDESGAGMMGVVAFNSACFYRYMRIDWDLLVKNLSNDAEMARKTVEAVLLASIAAIPTGKQNSFAAQNLPDLILGVVRKDGESWSLANAFEKPVKADREGGFLAPSVRALDTYWGRLTRIYGSDGVQPVALVMDETTPLQHLQTALVSSRNEWVSGVLARLE